MLLLVRGEEIVMKIKIPGDGLIKVFDALMINETNFMLGSTKGLEIVDHSGKSLGSYFVGENCEHLLKIDSDVFAVGKYKLEDLTIVRALPDCKIV